MIGKIISHYKILEKLGEGGMGVVYKAEDTKLKRTVALKFLPKDLTRNTEAKERFVQEAQAAAVLNHPNICTIYEIDEVEGQSFIAMEYLDGQSLRDRIESGPFKIDEAVYVTIQVAEGLQEAHGKGIVHRDIKSANIMVTVKDQAKIMDFGLAKLAGGMKLTKTGITMGTTAYMSPEQTQGKEVDHRTDIWSLGVVLYEMLTGQLPFSGEYEQAVVYWILNEDPEPLATFRTDIPKYLEQVVSKTLEKDKTQRYQNIHEFLKASPFSVITSLPQEKSIVVLPFEDISPGKDNEYFSDGLTEEIISDLSKVQVLKVISRSSAMTFKGTKKKISAIAKDVNVQYVLEGSVRKAGNNLRITAQLIEAANDVHLWAEKYSGTLDDVFDIQEKVSRSIVDALKLKLSHEEDKKIAERSVENVRAYECYIKARQEMVRWSEDSIEHAFQLLQNGLEIIGDNADLYGGMGLAYIYCHELGIKADENPLERAEEFANKVNKLKPDSQHYPYLFGRIERFRGSALKTIGHFKKALAIDSNDPETLAFQGYLISTFAGKPSIAEPYVKKVIEIDPLTPFNYIAPAMFYSMKGELGLAVKSWRKFFQMDPENRYAKVYLLWSLSWNKQLDEAYELVDQIVNENSKDLPACISLFFKYSLQGEKAKALHTMTEDVKKFCWNDPDLPWITAGYYSLINEKKQALDWLEHAINRGFINYPILNEEYRFLENIRGEPRFKKLMERVKYEWENFEV